jgi:uncharacterized protein
MPQYLTPGVYVEEIPSASKPIEGVSTSVAAFVGIAPFGPMNTAVQIANWGQFERTFGNPYDPKAGPFMKGAYLAHAVYGFFHNGGNLCYVVRVGAGSAAGAPQAELPAEGDTAMGPFRVVARADVPGPINVTLIEEEPGTNDKEKIARAEKMLSGDGDDEKGADEKAADDKAADDKAADDKAADDKAADDKAADEKGDSKEIATADSNGGRMIPPTYTMVVTRAEDPKKASAAPPAPAPEAADAADAAASKKTPPAGTGDAAKATPAGGELPTAEKPDDLRQILIGLTLESGSNFIVTKVNRDAKWIALEETGPAPIGARPELTPGTQTLEHGGQLKPLVANDVTGSVTNRTGVAGLAAIDEITMVCVPDIMAVTDKDQRTALQGAMVAHCDEMRDRMAIVDAPKDMSPQEVGDWRGALPWGDSKFAALYYPWLEVMDPIDNQPIMIPPCGHMAGVWARTDGTRGVHKAPANEAVMGITGLAYQVTDSEQELLNPNGVNCIRAFPGRGIRVWGARTMSSDPEWTYINVRRLFNFVSESINEGTQWAVFEPNDASLWTQLRISSTNFLTRIWRDGALFGATPGEAFYVKCDAETNPPDLVEAGQVTVEIGIAPVKPAEFVVFRISQFQAGAAA